MSLDSFGLTFEDSQESDESSPRCDTCGQWSKKLFSHSGNRICRLCLKKERGK